ncbi:prohibitin family protein [candidate division KSB1 bacterium]|nr:prohibitin family protein [candidate division KSB1 bacterium]
MENVQEKMELKEKLLKRFGNHLKRSAQTIIVVTLIVLIICLVLWQRVVISIGSGEAGVLWQRFNGTVIDRYFDEGIHIISPLDKMYIYNIRNQEVKDSLDVLSVNGLTIHLYLSVRYHPHVDILPILHKEVGPDYVQVVVLPEIEAVVRTIIGQYKPEELYTAQKAIAEQLYSESFKQVEERYIALDDILIKRIRLPEKIKVAIESKLEQQQLAQEYEFRLLREQKEAMRKKVEADGIAVFSKCLSDQVLKWHGIKATEELAKSPNSKIIVIGSGSKEMPIILGGQ